MINQKRGKRRQKGSKVAIPFEVVGMDIEYREETS